MWINAVKWLADLKFFKAFSMISQTRNEMKANEQVAMTISGKVPFGGTSLETGMILWLWLVNIENLYGDILSRQWWRQ